MMIYAARLTSLLLMTIAAAGGCGFIGGFDAPKVKTGFQHREPLRMTTEEARSIRVLIVAPPADRTTKEKTLVYLAEELGRAGRFKVLSPATFLQEARKQNVEMALMTEAERIALTRSVAKTLGADAVLLFTTEDAAVRTGAQILIGKGTATGRLRLRAYAAEADRLLWEQAQDTEATLGAFRGREDEDRLMREQLDPLIKNFLASF